MGHRNTQFIGRMIDMETDPQGHSHLHPEPSVYYQSFPNFPQTNFPFRPVHEHPDNTMYYAVPPYNAIQPQHPSASLDLAVRAPASLYGPYMAPPSGIHAHQGAHEQFHYNMSVGYMDDLGGSYKRKNAEGAPVNFQCHTASAGPSSSVAPMTARLSEPDITAMDSTSLFQPCYARNDPAPVVESGAIANVRSMHGIVGPESVMPHNSTPFGQGNYVVAPPIQLSGNPLHDMHFGANNGDIGTYRWTQAPNLSYMPANVNGPCLEAGNMAMAGYHIKASNRGSNGFLHPQVTQGHHNPPHPTQPIQGMMLPHMSSRRIPSTSSSNNGIMSFQNLADAVHTYQPPLPTGFRVYGGHHRRENVLDLNARHHHAHMRVLPEDAVAIAENQGHHEAGDSADQHRDMRLDIDHMSYEELLALGEQIGTVITGLTEEFIQNNLQTRGFTTSAACVNLGEMTSYDQQIDFCVVCQTEYEDGETVGTLDCGHEYHRDCVKKWLQMKNACPVCKSTALKGKGKDS